MVFTHLTQMDFEPSMLNVIWQQVLEVGPLFQGVQMEVATYRGWENYTEGFGTLCNEFWFGLDKINRLSKSDYMILRVDMQDFENKTGYAEYKIFDVSNEADQYKSTIRRRSGQLLYFDICKASWKLSDNPRYQWLLKCLLITKKITVKFN